VLDEEFPELWTEFLPRSLSLFTSSDQKQIQVGAELLLFLYKKHRFTQSVAITVELTYLNNRFSWAHGKGRAQQLYQQSGEQLLQVLAENVGKEPTIESLTLSRTLCVIFYVTSSVRLSSTFVLHTKIEKTFLRLRCAQLLVR